METINLIWPPFKEDIYKSTLENFLKDSYNNKIERLINRGLFLDDEDKKYIWYKAYIELLKTYIDINAQSYLYPFKDKDSLIQCYRVVKQNLVRPIPSIKDKDYSMKLFNHLYISNNNNNEIIKIFDSLLRCFTDMMDNPIEMYNHIYDDNDINYWKNKLLVIITHNISDINKIIMVKGNINQLNFHREDSIDSDSEFIDSTSYEKINNFNLSSETNEFIDSTSYEKINNFNLSSEINEFSIESDVFNENNNIEIKSSQLYDNVKLTKLYNSIKLLDTPNELSEYTKSKITYDLNLSDRDVKSKVLINQIEINNNNPLEIYKDNINSLIIEQESALYKD